MRAALDPPGPVSVRRQRTREPVLAALAKVGTSTRAELSRLTGLSRTAVSDCVASLLAEGVLTEAPSVASAPSGRGRRAGAVSLCRPAGILLGLDLGHAHITAAAGTAGGEVLAASSGELDVDHQPEQALELAAVLVQRALRESGRSLDEVLGVVAGIPGPLDTRTQIVRAPSILSDWVDLDPAAELRRRLGTPVIVGNDADMGAVGERAFGAARGLDDFLYIKSSHGIGAGVVLAGQTYRGSIGIAGEIGHTQIPGASNWCRCGSRGCLETVVSVSTVRRQLAHVLTTSDSAPEAIDVLPLAQLVENPAAARVITDAGRMVGRVVADLVNCLNPAAIILGGELGAAGAPFAIGVRESIDRYSQPAAAAAVHVAPGRLGPRAELLGTLATAAQEFASGAGRGSAR